MLLFNNKKEFVGIDEKDLQILGFTSLSDLLSEVDDFADMFVKKTGYIHNFTHVNWIDLVEYADSIEDAKVIIHANGKNFQCFLSVEIIYLTNDSSLKAFVVNLHNIIELTGDLVEESTPLPEPIVESISKPLPEPKISNPINPIVPLDVDFKDTDTKLIDAIETVSLATTNEVSENPYIFDPLIASKELGLPVDLIEEFIEDFILQSKEFKDDLYKALKDGEKDRLKILSHKLKGVAANLRIEDALESLRIVNTSDNNNKIQEELDVFYEIIVKLAKKTEETASLKSVPVSFEETLKEDELDIFSTPS